MALKYTGRADVLVLEGKVYATPILYKSNPDAYEGSFDDPLPIDDETALHMSEQSSMHTFETRTGKDLVESATDPMYADPAIAAMNTMAGYNDPNATGSVMGTEGAQATTDVKEATAKSTLVESDGPTPGHSVAEAKDKDGGKR